MPTIHLIEGPVGAGKSTFAGRLSVTQKIPHLNLDAWMVTLFSPDRPAEDFMAWYADCKGRCIEQIWAVACALLDCDLDVILELGLVQRSDRDAFYARVDGTDYQLEVTVLDTPLELRRQRVRERNAKATGTFQMQVSDEVFELANWFWESPDEAEIRTRGIKVLS
ncbi:MAG: AAA family ATPase [Pseudomonadota bacterium]